MSDQSDMVMPVSTSYETEVTVLPRIVHESVIETPSNPQAAPMCSTPTDDLVDTEFPSEAKFGTVT